MGCFGAGAIGACALSRGDGGSRGGSPPRSRRSGRRALPSRGPASAPSSSGSRQPVAPAPGQGGPKASTLFHKAGRMIAAAPRPVNGFLPGRRPRPRRAGPPRTRGVSALNRCARVSATRPSATADDHVGRLRIGRHAVDHRVPAVGLGEVGAGVDVRVVDHPHLEPFPFPAADLEEILRGRCSRPFARSAGSVRGRARGARPGCCGTRGAAVPASPGRPAGPAARRSTRRDSRPGRAAGSPRARPS